MDSGVSEVTNAFNSTFIVSRQPCSSARTVTMSSMQPENNKGTAVWASQKTAPLHTSSSNNDLLHSPKVKMNFSLSLISIFCSSRLPCKWDSQEWEMKDNPHGGKWDPTKLFAECLSDLWGRVWGFLLHIIQRVRPRGTRHQSWVLRAVAPHHGRSHLGERSLEQSPLVQGMMGNWEKGDR